MDRSTINAYIDAFSSLNTAVDQTPSPSLTESTSTEPTESSSSPNSLQDWSSSTHMSDQTFLNQLQADVFGNLPAWTEDGDYFTQYDGASLAQSPNDKSLKLMKRKAQNRAAQRAFRERKERSMRELEENVTSLRSKAADLEKENKRLATLLQEARIELKTLKSFSSLRPELKSAGMATSVSCSREASDRPSEIILRIDLGELTRMRASSIADGPKLEEDRVEDTT